MRCGCERAWLAIAVTMLTSNIAVCRSAAAEPVELATSKSDASYESEKTRARELARAGKISEAISAAERTVGLAERTYGAHHIETAVAHHTLGFLLRQAKQSDKARVALERALAFYETALPAVHEDTRNATGELGHIYIEAGRGAELAGIYARLIDRAGREGHASHIGVAHMLANQGFVLRGLARHDESEASFRGAVALYDLHSHLATESYRVTLDALLDRLAATRRETEMITRARGALASVPTTSPIGLAIVLGLHDRLSRTALEAGRAEEARTEAEAALTLLDRHAALVVQPNPGRSDPSVTALNNLARAHRAAGDFAGAESAYRRAITLLEQRGDKANAGIVTDNLAVLFLHQGRLDDAERLHKRALSLLEEALGREHPSVGQAAMNLGALLVEANRYDEAEPLLRRSLAIAQAQRVKNPVALGIIHDNLAGLLRITGRRAEARTNYTRALELFDGALPELHPRRATSRNNYGRFLLDTGSYVQAEVELRTALELSEAIYGATDYKIAVPAANLAEVYTATKRYDEARQLFGRALAALEAVYGPQHATLSSSLIAAASLELADGQPSAARSLFERAAAIEVTRRSRTGIVTGEGQRALLGLIESLWREGTSPATRDVERALETAQWDSTTPAAVALAALGARVEAGDPVLGALTRERQDLAAEWQSVDKRLTRLLSESGTRDAAHEARLRSRIGEIDIRLVALDAELSRRFPRYRDLARPVPLSLVQLRALLAPSEAAIQFTVAADATYVFAVTATEAHWYRAPVGDRELRTLVRNLRCGLDRAEWTSDGGKRCATRLGIDPSASPGIDDPLPFDITGAHALYRILLAPLAATLTGKDLLVVASGALTSLPLHVLVVDEPQGEHRSFVTANTDLARIAWLGRRTAITVLPSLASIGPLRQLAKTSAGTQPYLGIGNPLLTGADGTDRRAFDVPACIIAPETRTAARSQRIATASTSNGAVASLARPIAPVTLAPKTSVMRSTGAGLDTLRRQTPLPETADELCQVAAYARANPASVLTGEKATETNLKARSSEGSLSQARILHFATHGLIAGETAMFLAEKTEPSLLLTPPETASETDDGLLTASEVASLKLDADWVVLSACNTASGDEIGAEALSGLARAFFYAGARSLLVSHWAVESDATVKLVTATFEAMSRKPGMTQGQALSGAMASLIDRGGRDAHPANWAPFIVVGGNAPAGGTRILPAAATAPIPAVGNSKATNPTPKPTAAKPRAQNQRPPKPQGASGGWLGIFGN